MCSAAPRKLVLQSHLTLGDIVMLTAAVRDLHRTYPGRFITDVRTGFPELWLHNPYLTALDPFDPSVETLGCDTLLVARSGQVPCHYLFAFTDFLSRRLNLPVQPTGFCGDIHLSEHERSAPSPFRELVGQEVPFWIVCAGGKHDIPIKWWSAERYQEVIDHFRGRLQFVQVGHVGHHHPPLKGVMDLRGRTTLRQLVQLVHHSDGVLCGVTALMHLAAAVPRPVDRLGLRPCVVVAGGREPPHWEAYPGHQFVHTVGALECCRDGGCWKSRTRPLGDGASEDEPANLCPNVVESLPRCMHLITAGTVIERIETYLAGGTARCLRPRQARLAVRAVTAAGPSGFDALPLTLAAAREALEAFLSTLGRDAGRGIAGRSPSSTGRVVRGGNAAKLSSPLCAPEPPLSLGRGAGGEGEFTRQVRREGRTRDVGRGIVICAGGARYFTNAWVCINALRRHGCTLPIQLWHLGRQEMDPAMEHLVGQLQVECVDAFKIRRRHPVRRLGGWELKPYAMFFCRFRQVLLLDADNVPVRDPTCLFETRQFRDAGAVFWPDFGRAREAVKIWRSCGLEMPPEPEVESGQILVDKQRCRSALRLALWFNEHSDFYYQYLHGDKDTFVLAFRKLKTPYYLVPMAPERFLGGMYQHDLDGRRLFQHRVFSKWTLMPQNRRVPGFQDEDACFADLERLRRVWDGRIGWLRAGCSRRRLWRSSNHGTPGLAAWMISCPEREGTRKTTLASLVASDWPDLPLQVLIDPEKTEDRVERIARQVFHAMQQFLDASPEYLLLLEDDLCFNRHLRHNLEHWAPWRHCSITLAGLCNFGLCELAFDVASNSVAVAPGSIRGAQALLLARPAVEYFVKNWNSLKVPADLRLAQLAAQLGRPLYYHCPSLVQHQQVPSTWGGAYQGAVDFDPDWRA